jgi:hypothetical protein
VFSVRSDCLCSATAQRNKRRIVDRHRSCIATIIRPGAIAFPSPLPADAPGTDFRFLIFRVVVRHRVLKKQS